MQQHVNLSDWFVRRGEGYERQHTCRLVLCSWALRRQMCASQWCSFSRRLLIVDVGAVHLGCLGCLLALFTDFSGLGAILSIFLVVNTGFASSSVVTRAEVSVTDLDGDGGTKCPFRMSATLVVLIGRSPITHQSAAKISSAHRSCTIRQNEAAFHAN